MDSICQPDSQDFFTIYDSFYQKLLLSECLFGHVKSTCEGTLLSRSTRNWSLKTDGQSAGSIGRVETGEPGVVALLSTSVGTDRAILWGRLTQKMMNFIRLTCSYAGCSQQ